ncbi:MAG: ribonuclease HII [Nanoarchaeota archaeon]|nr:ribonuclease HII [Nanoarchaeota archaeon]
MALICGIDEAGRGPVIGPMVMAGVLVDEKDIQKLKDIGVKDSKLLTEDQRNQQFPKILKIVKRYHILIVEPKEIDRAVNGHDGLNLNWLEAHKTAEIINELKPDKVMVDSPTATPSKYKDYLRKLLTVKVELNAENKADLNYVEVGAASILAKVTRDTEVAKIRKKVKHDFGSGYCSDPKTAMFLKEHYHKFPNIFRHSWSSCRVLVEKAAQTSLVDFEDEPAFKEVACEDLKELERYGYKFVKTKTAHEVARLKGDCTITLYTTGKMLVQGKEENKIYITRILKNMGYEVS